MSRSFVSSTLFSSAALLFVIVGPSSSCKLALRAEEEYVEYFLFATLGVDRLPLPLDLLGWRWTADLDLGAPVNADTAPVREANARSWSRARR